MADGGEPEVDLETLQAQIDMSLAFTHNIVAGWMTSSKAKLPSSSRANDDRELEEYMRRPPRCVPTTPSFLACPPTACPTLLSGRRRGPAPAPSPC